jgi:phosphoribosyl 1,2-cyclic phosphodiesterase
MSFRFSVLASGSSGNAALLISDGARVLIDCGLGTRRLEPELAARGLAWADLDGVLLTHTHDDHFRDRTLAKLTGARVPLYCHAHHAASLRKRSLAFAEAETRGLVRGYDVNEELSLGACAARAFAVSHDDFTCGFRFWGAGGFLGVPWAIGYATDLGTWSEDLVPHLADVDVLALEFNHDVHLETTSGRSSFLIARVLGDHGHLSNVQAAALLEQALRASTPGRLRHVVLLHLSRQCNRPELARSAAERVREACAGEFDIHVAPPHRATPDLTPAPRRRAKRPVQRVEVPPIAPQALFPGWDD